MAQKSGFKILSAVVIGAIALIMYIAGNAKPKSSPAASSSTSSQSQQETKSTGSGKYMLNFPDSFNAALASQDDLGLSIAIAIDCSGSMRDLPADGSSDSPKYRVAQESLAEIIRFIHTFYNENVKKEHLRLRLALLSFSDDVKELFPLSDITESSFTNLNRIVGNYQNFMPGGKTAIGKTLEKGTEILAQSETIFKSLIIISDGDNTTGVEPDKVINAIVNNINNRNSSDFPVLTNSVLVSFIGFDIEETYFSRFSRLGARVTSAANKKELDANLKALFLADITKLEAE